jgi:hypothetical protein
MRKKMLRLFLTVCMAVGLGTTVNGAVAGTPDKGAADMLLEGGSRGEVPFPHRRHQDALKEDCAACHDLFPQKRGSIEALKAEGRLAPKQVMNKLCTGCHRQYRREGINAGPTTCSQCHQER